MHEILLARSLKFSLCIVSVFWSQRGNLQRGGVLRQLLAPPVCRTGIGSRPGSKIGGGSFGCSESCNAAQRQQGRFWSSAVSSPASSWRRGRRGRSGTQRAARGAHCLHRTGDEEARHGVHGHFWIHVSLDTACYLKALCECSCPRNPTCGIPLCATVYFAQRGMWTENLIPIWISLRGFPTRSIPCRTLLLLDFR